MAGVKDSLSGAYNVLKGTVTKFGAENGPLIAAAVSFYALLSLIPLLLLAVSILGYVVGSSDKAFSSVMSMIGSFTPTTGFVSSTLQGLVKARGTIGLVGLISLLWTGSQFFVILQTALDDIWEVTGKPGFIRARVKAIILVLVFGVLLLISIGSTSLSALLRTSLAGYTSPYLAFLLSIVAIVVGFLSAIGMFLVVYKYVPYTKVEWKPALLGAIVAGIAWTIAKGLYGIYLTHANFNALYGSLGSVVILVLWIYYSSVITIFGAELGYVNEHGPREVPEEKQRMDEK